MSHWRWRLWIQANEPPIEYVAIDPPPKPLPPRFRPNLDPIYRKLETAAARRGPRSAYSTAMVSCWVCGDQHALWERKRWNGSYSYCPACGSDIVTFAKEEIVLRARV